MAGVQGRVAVVTGGLAASVLRRPDGWWRRRAGRPARPRRRAVREAADTRRTRSAWSRRHGRGRGQPPSARVVEQLGGLHVLVNNAGVTRDNLLFKLTESDWDTVIAVHLKGAFHASGPRSRYFVPRATDAS